MAISGLFDDMHAIVSFALPAAVTFPIFSRLKTVKQFCPILILLISWQLQPAAAAERGHEIRLQVNGVERTALVFAPATGGTNPAPLVFVFHGHGGNSRNAQRSFHIETEWPEAIVVYPQGLNTPGALVDPQGTRSGWQGFPGGQGDRDLKFFDALLSRLKNDYNVDAKRIYSTGHSNGGIFTYLLWLERSEVFAAMAPCAASAPYAKRLNPKPAMPIAGEKDTLVKFEWQQRTMESIRQVNGCAARGEAWERNCALYPSSGGTPVVTLIHPGAHVVPPSAPGLIVKFFKQFSKS